jgi:hypothetical protein
LARVCDVIRLAHYEGATRSAALMHPPQEPVGRYGYLQLVWDVAINLELGV